MNLVPNMSVRHKLILSTISAIALMLGILGTVAHFWNAKSEADKIDAFLVADSSGSTNAITTAMTEFLDAGTAPSEMIRSEQFIEYLKVYFRNRLNRPAKYKTTMAITTTDDAVLAASNDALPVSAADLAAPIVRLDNQLLQEDGSTLLSVHRNNLNYRLIIVPIRLPQVTVAYVRLACLLSPASESTLLFDRTLLAILGAIALFTGIGSILLITRTLRPVHDMRIAAEHITERNLDSRLPQPPGSDEIAGLARTFNHFLARIEAAYQFQVRVVDDLSHQLRTPLTILRGSMDLVLRRDPDKAVYRQTMEDCLADVDRMSSFLMTMLSLARLESRVIPLRLEQTDIAALIRELVGDMEPLWQENRQVVVVRLASPGQEPDKLPSVSPVLMIDRVMFSQAVMNILSNAFKYCPPGGRIEVAIFPYATESPPQCRIVIANNGPAIPEADLERIFERFYRGTDTGESVILAESQILDGGTQHIQGFGLGLNIAQNIIELHKGSIRAFNPAAGGSAFEILLPY